MKTNRTITLFCIAFLALFIAGQAFADIVVYRSGSHIECTLVDVDDKHVTIKTEYGEQKIPRRELLGWYQKELGKPGSDFFRAGELLAGRGMRNKAIKLFEKAIALDPANRQPAERALAGMPSTGVDSTATGGRMIVVGPKMVTKVLMCPICAGEGELLKERETEVTTIRNKVPCWFCSGKGIGILRYPEGTRICPTCGGWGHTRLERVHSTGDSDNADKKKMGDEKDNVDFRHPCWQCRGLGYIGQPKALGTAIEHIDLFTASTDEGSTGYTNQAGGRTSHPGSGPVSDPSMRSSVSESDEDDEEVEDEEEEEEEDDSWFKKNKILVLLIGGGALLIVVLVMSQSSKK